MEASATSLHILHRVKRMHTLMLTQHIQYGFHIKVYCVVIVCQGLVSEDVNEPRLSAYMCV